MRLFRNCGPFRLRLRGAASLACGTSTWECPRSCPGPCGVVGGFGAVGAGRTRRDPVGARHPYGECREISNPPPRSPAVLSGARNVPILESRFHPVPQRPSCDYGVSCLTNAPSIDRGEFDHRTLLTSQPDISGRAAGSPPISVQDQIRVVRARKVPDDRVMPCASGDQHSDR